MKSLLFIESPLQLLNAYEAIDTFKLKNYKVVVRLSGEELNDTQLINVVNYLNINNIKYITININNRTLLDYLLLILNRFKYLFNNVEKVFIGNSDSGFFKLIMKQFNKSKIILLDDGSKTLSIQKRFTENNFYNIFTMYDIQAVKNQIIYKNKYNSIFNICKNKNKNKNKNVILFLGTKLSEISIIDETYYLELLNKISMYFTDKKIIYIPHRGESKEKLKKIARCQNLIVKHIDYPVELYGIYEENIPYKVVSFYSTAIFTMKNIYHIEAESFHFNYINSVYKTNIDTVYKYYAKYLKVTETDALI